MIISKNDDIIIYTNISQDSKTSVVKLTSKCIPDFIAEKEEYIRVSSYKADWTLTPIAGGKVKLEFVMKVDPGGSIPDWLINLAAAEGPIRTIKNLRSFLPKYQNITLNYIKDK